MNSMNCRRLMLAAALVSGANLFAADFHVATSQELQNALTTAASNGVDDTIFLAEGAYQGNFNFQTAEGQNLTIQGEPGVLPEDITLDGGGVGGALNLNCSAAVTVTLQGFTVLRNSGDLRQSALSVTTTGDVVVTDMNFYGNEDMQGQAAYFFGVNTFEMTSSSVTMEDDAGGRGIWLEDPEGDVTLTDSVFRGNSDDRAFDVDRNFRSDDVYGDALVSGCQFENNYTGLHIRYLSTTIENCVFHNQTAGNRSGTAVYYSGDSDVSNFILRDCQFTSNNSNTSSGRGGGLYVGGTSSALITQSRFEHNFNSGGGAIGVHSRGSRVDIMDCDFIDCSSWTNGGGAIYTDRHTVIENCRFINAKTNRETIGHGGAIRSSSTLTVQDSLFENCSTANAGGAIYHENSDTTLRLERNRFIGCFTFAASPNQVHGGGAIFVDSRQLFAYNNLFADCRADSGQGGAIYVRPHDVFVKIYNNTITRCSARIGGGVRVELPSDDEVVELFNNIIWGNSASQEGGDIYLSGFGSTKVAANNTYSDLFGVFDDATQGNIDVAPIFFNPDAGDYHVRVGSLTIDAGDNQYVDDDDLTLDQQPRIVGSAVDMGCFEFDNTGRHPADTDENGVITQAEFDAYSTAWKTDADWPTGPSPVPADYLTRAGFILNEGGAYFNDGGGLPIGWKPGNQ